MSAGANISATLLALMQRGADTPIADDEFNSLALRVFGHQFDLNAPYRRYCERRERTPLNVTDWTHIPAVPTAAFKEVALVAGNAADAKLIFKTSGTTRGAEKRGAHYILDPALYEASLLPTFRRFVLRGSDSMRMLSLIPPADELTDSSLSYMITHVVRQLGSAGSGFHATTAGGLDVAGVAAALSGADGPICLLGTSLAFMHFMEALGQTRFTLPSGSRLMDTGGFKGERREITAGELRTLYQEKLGIAADDCINEYGMTELCSQYYDAQPEIKRGPPWLRARVVDPDSLRPVPAGETGILQHFDLANLHSVSAVQTEDLAIETDTGFVLLGRAPGASPRGCSIAMDILLADARGS